MENFYIDIRNENSIICDYFKNKDIVSIDELLGAIEDLKLEVERLQEQIEDREKDIADNFRRISVEEQVGMKERDFICD